MGFEVSRCCKVRKNSFSLFVAAILFFSITLSVYSQNPTNDFSDTKVSQDEQIDESERISLDLKGINIKELFRLLSVKTKKTIVTTKGVTGRVSLFLNNVTFKDALDVILLTQGLASEQIGDILMIMAAVEYKARYGKNYDENREFRRFKLKFAKPSAIFNALGSLKSDIGNIIIDEATGTVILMDIPEKLDLMEKTAKDLDIPLKTEVFDLNYAEAEDIRTHLASVITEGTGQLFVDEKTSRVMVSDLPDKMIKIKKMIDAFDDEVLQVFIEAEILQVTLKKEFQKGVNWERVFNKLDNTSLHGLNAAGDFPVQASFTPRVALSTTDDEDVTTYNRGQMTIGTLASDNYDLTVQLLETFGDTKILSRPRIMVVNNEEAKILIGTREAYITGTTTTGDTTTVSESIEFIDVGVKLNVVPEINRKGFVIMKIKPEISSIAETITTAAGSRVPIVDTSEAETKVKVKDGTMIMIAGLMKEEKRKDITGFPLLSKIPILGWFFRSEAELKEKTEIIIFLRPHIVSGETTFAGTEYEKKIPPDILPKDVKDSVILKELEKIRSFSAADQSSDIIIEPIDIEQDKTSIVLEKEWNEILQEKLKGLKEYGNNEK